MVKELTQPNLNSFTRYLVEEEKSEATVNKYLHDVRVFFSFLGKRSLVKDAVIEYKRHLGESYATASANSMIAALNSYLRFLGKDGLCIKQFRVQRNAFYPEDKELTREEYLRLSRAAEQKKNERLSMIIQTICSTGIRVSELKYITVEAVMAGQATVRLKGKTRVVFLVSKLRKKLLAYIKRESIKSGIVFVTKGGKPVNRSNIWRDMKALCKDAGISAKKVFPHNLRHLFARTFYGIEKDIAKLADVLGHSSINTTRIYVASSGKEHKNKMEHMRLLL